MAKNEAAVLDIPRFEHWADVALEVAPDAADEEVRRAIVGRLVDDDWLSSNSQRTVNEAAAAVAVEVIPSERTTSLAYVAAEKALRPAVEQFAERLFRELIAERVRQWHALWQQTAEFSALRARLKRLQPALGVALPTFDDERFRRLTDLAAKWIVARPGNRGDLRLEIDRALPSDALERFRFVDEFRRAAPQLMTLAPTMFDDLPKPARAFKPPAAHVAWKEAGSESALQHSGRIPVYRNERPSWLSGTGVVFLIIMVVRVLFNAADKSSKPAPGPSPTQFTIPLQQNVTREQWRRQGYSEAEIDKRMQAQELLRKLQLGKPAPDAPAVHVDSPNEQNRKAAVEWLNQNRDKIRPGSALDKLYNGGRSTNSPSPSLPTPNVPNPNVPRQSSPSFGGAPRSGGGAPSPPGPGR